MNNLGVNPFLKEAMQKQLESEYPVGKSVEFYEKLSPGFKGKYDPVPKQGIITKVKHPFIYVESAGKEYLLYQGEIKNS